MVNRTGQNAGLPRFGSNKSVSAPLEPVSYGTASRQADGSVFKSISTALKNASGHIEDRLDLVAKIEGRTAGAIAGQKGVPSMMDEATIRGQAFNTAARDAVETQFELKGITTLTDLEQKYSNDPVGFSEAATAWLKGTQSDGSLANFDPAISQKFEANFQLRMKNTLSRIHDRHDMILRDQQTESVLQLQSAIQNEIPNAADQLFADSTSPENKADILNQMIKSGAEISKTAHSIGPDGRFLFDASERVRLGKMAESTVGLSILSSWRKTQPDVITAYNALINGEAYIELPDVNAASASSPMPPPPKKQSSAVNDLGGDLAMPPVGDNYAEVSKLSPEQRDAARGAVPANNKTGVRKVLLKDLLGPTTYRLAQEDMMNEIKAQLAMEAQVEASKERTFKKNSDTIFGTMAASAQDGQITLTDVEAVRDQLDTEHYLTLREMAKNGGASVSDGRVVSEMLVRDSTGEDIRPLLRNAYRDGKLTTSDFNKYYVQNTERLNEGLTDPINAARDSLLKRLGSMSTAVDDKTSSSIGQASFEFEKQVFDFQQKNGRVPSYDEVDQIVEKLYNRFSLLSIEGAYQSSSNRLPLSISRAEITSINSQQVAEKTKIYHERKLSEFGGDIEKLKNDPEYQREIILLKKFHDSIKSREENARANKQ